MACGEQRANGFLQGAGDGRREFEMAIVPDEQRRAWRGQCEHTRVRVAPQPRQELGATRLAGVIGVQASGPKSVVQRCDNKIGRRAAGHGPVYIDGEHLATRGAFETLIGQGATAGRERHLRPGRCDRASRAAFPLAPVERAERRDEFEEFARMDAADVGLEPKRFGDPERLRVMSRNSVGKDAQVEGIRRRDERLTRGDEVRLGFNRGSGCLLLLLISNFSRLAVRARGRSISDRRTADNHEASL